MNMTTKINRKAGLGRRDVLKVAGLGALALAGTGFAGRAAHATAEDAQAALDKMTGGAAAGAKEGKITFDLPEIAENGRTVPITVTVESPMTDADHVKQIHLVSEGNPVPDIGTFNLTPAMGKAEIKTRIRLGMTQNVVAAAVMSDGSVYVAKREVKVTVGGCGG